MKTILFIEDEPTLQKELTRYLEGQEYKIIKALDGEQGLEMAKTMPDLILLDLILPKKDGFEVLQELKEDPKLKNIPVIVLTNLESSKEVKQAIELGARSYLVKANYSLEEVKEKIQNILE